MTFDRIDSIYKDDEIVMRKINLLTSRKLSTYLLTTNLLLMKSNLLWMEN